MSIWDWSWLGIGRAASSVMTLPQYGIQSPWQPSPLETLDQINTWSVGSQLFEDIFGETPRPVTRAEAMSVPAVARARHLICTTVARLPLAAFRADEKVDPTPSFMTATDGQLGDLTDADKHRFGLFTGQSPYQRMLRVADDVLFFGFSMLYVTRWGAPDVSGRKMPLRMCHVPQGFWAVNADGEIVDVDGAPLPADRVILVEGPHSGILSFGSRTIRGAGQLEQTALDVSQRPFRLALRQTTDLVLTPDERREIVSETRRALSDNQGILFVNSALELQEFRMDSSDFLVGARNSSALDIARLTNTPASMLDASVEGSSLEYSTVEGRNLQWLDFGLASYLDAIAARLSEDDVLPQGQRTEFVTDGLTTYTAPHPED